MINILPTHSGTAVPNLSFLLEAVTSFQEELKKKIFFKEEYGVLPGLLNFSFSKVKYFKPCANPNVLSVFVFTGNVDHKIRCIAPGILFYRTGQEKATISAALISPMLFREEC